MLPFVPSHVNATSLLIMGRFEIHSHFPFFIFQTLRRLLAYQSPISLKCCILKPTGHSLESFLFWNGLNGLKGGNLMSWGKIRVGDNHSKD